MQNVGSSTYVDGFTVNTPMQDTCNSTIPLFGGGGDREQETEKRERERRKKEKAKRGEK
jgi:hypothetical protein